MPKFNTTAPRVTHGQGPIVASATPDTVTHEGAPAHTRDTRSELFMLAVTNFVGEDTYYESAANRDARYAQLVRNVALTDPVWLTRFLRWLRSDGNMRSASLVGAAEMVHARLGARAPSVPAYEVPGWDGDRGIDRAVVEAVCQRPDEPGEFVAYWLGRHGRSLPMPVKRGLADACRRLYTEHAMLKYDTPSHGVRFADVLDLTHPRPVAPWQGALFQYALARRHNRPDLVVPPQLRMVAAQEELRRAALGNPAVLLDPQVLRQAGMTWEDTLSLAGPKADKRALWEALIPSMGMMALLRNLRNFDEAGVSDSAAGQVIARFMDAGQVARSRMLPFRWVSAFRSTPSLRWGHALDRALQHSLAGLPALGGRTLLLVDTSSSMTAVAFSGRSKVPPVTAAAVFGVALAAAGEQVELFGFADGRNPFRHQIPKGASVIREVNRFVSMVGRDGHGTCIAESLRKTFRGHDRVIIVSDMQTMGGGVSAAVPAEVPMYGFNLGGYRPTVLPSRPGRIELGGLTDATFRMIPLIEAGRNADWPF